MCASALGLAALPRNNWLRPILRACGAQTSGVRRCICGVELIVAGAADAKAAAVRAALLLCADDGDGEVLVCSVAAALAVKVASTGGVSRLLRGRFRRLAPHATDTQASRNELRVVLLLLRPLDSWTTCAPADRHSLDRHPRGSYTLQNGLLLLLRDGLVDSVFMHDWLAAFNEIASLGNELCYAGGRVVKCSSKRWCI